VVEAFSNSQKGHHNSHSELENVLLFRILVDPTKAVEVLISNEYFELLSFQVKDLYRSVLQKLLYLCSSAKFQQLHFQVRKQVSSIHLS
jgi:hypothetical protein